MAKLTGLFACMLLSGCVAKEPVYITKYETVSVPVVCDAAVPSRPAYSPDTADTVNRVLTYAERLEALLQYCKGGENVQD